MLICISLVALAVVLTAGAKEPPRPLPQLSARMSEPAAQLNVVRGRSEAHVRVEPAGYVGPLPCDAVARWQVAHGFEPVGLFRAKAIARCEGARGDRMRRDPPKPEDDPQCKKWTNEGWCSGGCTRAAPGGKTQCVMPECAQLPDGVIPPSRPARCVEYF